MSVSIQLEFPVAERRQVDVVRDLSDYGEPHPSGLTRQRPRRAVAQSEDRALRRIAAARIRAIALYREERAKLAPEQVADREQSMVDARIALCIAQGVALDDIDPSSGYSMSRSSYEAVRHSWISSMRYHGFNDEYERESFDEALAFWAERRPQYLDGDDWLAAGLAAHREYWQGIGHGCGAPYCDVHSNDSLAPKAAGE
ncbi:hypothetical protein [Streptomyces sp. NPDC003395]